jgi:hypothetical protein
MRLEEEGHERVEASVGHSPPPHPVVIPGVGKEAPSSPPPLNDPPLLSHTRGLIPRYPPLRGGDSRRKGPERRVRVLGNSSPLHPVSHTGCGEGGAELPSSAE